MNVFIIEDEVLAAKLLVRLLNELDQDIRVVGQADNIKDAVAWFEENPHPDLVFSDIELTDGQSFEIFEQVEVASPVIFTTAYDDFALKAYKANAIDYLVKPIEIDALERALDKYHRLKTKLIENRAEEVLHTVLSSNGRGNVGRYKSRFLVKMGERLVSLTNDQIAYFLSEDKLVFLITKENKKYPVDFTLDELDHTIDPNVFFRLNRQVIAHIDSINTIHSYFNGKLKISVKPPLDKETLVSREKAGSFKEWLDR